MNKSNLTKRTLLASAVMGVLAIAGANVAVAGIAGSKHDLGSGGASQYGSTMPTTEICVFCHTPHGSDNSASAPLWNKKLTAASYTRYSSLNTSSQDSKETAIGSVSLACLSCHDGTQAMDVMINKPGSGGYNAAGSQLASGAAMTGSPIPMLGTDLSNDHPVSMQYGGGGAKAADSDGAFTGELGDKDFSKPVKATINSVPVWWVDTTSAGTVGTRDKTDMQLFTREDAAIAGGKQPFVECASCHDPHAAGNPTFLRVPNDGSQVCLTCHTK